jgi:hypothetical protein
MLQATPKPQPADARPSANRRVIASSPQKNWASQLVATFTEKPSPIWPIGRSLAWW